MVGAGSPITVPGLARSGAKRGGAIAVAAASHLSQSPGAGGFLKTILVRITAGGDPLGGPSTTPRYITLPLYPFGGVGVEGVAFLHRERGGPAASRRAAALELAADSREAVPRQGTR